MTELSVPFKLGELNVDPKTDELSCGDTRLKVQSMAMRVLCYLGAHPNEVISRDELRMAIWQNSIASDQTINNHIYNLRRSLASLDKDTKFIHTVTGSSGNGYRLLVPVIIEQTQPLSAEKPKAIDNTKSKAKLQPIAAVVIIVLVLLSTLLYEIFKPLNYDNVTGLTFMQGREQSPAVSTDGRFIIYSHRPNRRGRWELYASALGQTEKVTKVFSEFGNDDNFVSISPSQNRIAFNRLRRGEEGIYVAEFDAKTFKGKVTKRVIALDRNNLSPAISWQDDSRFFYTKREAAKAPLRIYQYDLTTQQTIQISSPPLGIFGDFAIALSPNKKWLAVMRAKGYMGFRLLMYEVSTKTFTQTPVSAQEQRLNVSFSDDSTSVYFVDDAGIVSAFNIAEKTITAMSDKPYMGYWPLKVPGKELFVMQQDWGLSSLTTQILRYNNPRMGGDGASSLLVNNGMSIRSIEGVAKDGLIFASIKPNFHIELWRHQDGKTYKLSHFNEKPQYRYPLSLDWLPGSQTALLSVNQTCLLVNTLDGSDSPLCPAEKSVYGGTFNADGKQIYLAQRIEEHAQAYLMGASGYPFKLITNMPSAGIVKQSPNGDIYYREDPSFDIYRHDNQSGENHLVIDRTYLNHGYSSNDFAIVAQGIYFIDKKADKPNAVYFYHFESQQTTHIIDSPNEYPNIALSEDEQFIYQIQSVDNDSQLLLLEPSR